MQVFHETNGMVAGTRQVYSYTWRVPSSCIRFRPLQGLPLSTGEGARLFLYRVRGSAFFSEWDSPMQKLKDRIFKVIQPDREARLESLIFDWIITGLVLVSVTIVFAVTFDLPEDVYRTLWHVEEFVSIIFTIEYVLRIWTADCLYPSERPWRARLRYVISPMALIDVVSIMPYWLPMFLPGSMFGMRAIRLIRMLRILKLNRYFDAMASIAEVLRVKRRELLGSIFFVFLLMLISSLLIYAAEHEAQPEVFRNAFSGLWWAVATLTTVGYGDLYPITVVGRLLGAFIALLGVAAVAIPTGIISSGLMERFERRKNRPKTEMSRCPHCGKEL